jgi:amino acid adenylation domain-containing protein
MPDTQTTPTHMAHGFLQSVRRYPQHPALLIGGEEITYATLHQLASDLAAALSPTRPDAAHFTLVLAHKSVTAHAAVLGALMAGRGYVPLNPAFPVVRNKNILVLSGADTLVVGNEAAHLLPDLLTDAPPLRILMPNTDDVSKLREQFTDHIFQGSQDIHKTAPFFGPLPDTPNATAYLLFTSGSTGTPKGVPVSHGNGCAFIRFTTQEYSISENDRIAQTSDLTFDFSVQPMFMAWEAGSCLCVVPDTALMAPIRFINEHKVTVWISVPSVIHFADRLRLLKPNAMPSVRLSMFCGEALTAESAQAWQNATRNGAIINLYGPTEATVAITHYPWDSVASPQASEDGVVPIGWMFDSQRGLVVNEDLRPAAQGEVGELLLTGSQVTKRYHNNPEMTARQYVTLPSEPDTLWYRTGDLVRQGEDGCFYYKGRIDDQVQIHGYRVVLQEVACALKEITATDLVAVVAWPLSQGHADAVHGFVSDSVAMDAFEIMEACRRRLPNYMVPKTIIKLGEFPLSTNGKINRKILASILEDNVKGSAKC